MLSVFLFTHSSPVQVDKLVETKGLDYVDREKAKRHAKQQAEQIYEQQYGNRDVGGDGGNWGNVGQQYGVGGGGGMPMLQVPACALTWVLHQHVWMCHKHNQTYVSSLQYLGIKAHPSLLSGK